MDAVTGIDQHLRVNARPTAEVEHVPGGREDLRDDTMHTLALCQCRRIMLPWMVFGGMAVEGPARRCSASPHVRLSRTVCRGSAARSTARSRPRWEPAPRPRRKWSGTPLDGPV